MLGGSGRDAGPQTPRHLANWADTLNAGQRISDTDVRMTPMESRKVLPRYRGQNTEDLHDVSR